MLSNLRCWIGRHAWRKTETQDGEICGVCSRCGKRDWHRYDTANIEEQRLLPQPGVGQMDGSGGGGY